MATNKELKTFKQFVSPDPDPDLKFVSPDLKGVTAKDLEGAKEYLNPDKTPKQKKKMN